MSTTRPLLIDGFCGAGGAAKGYHDAGFDVIGVDVEPQPRYPYTFMQADFLEFLRRRVEGMFASGPWWGTQPIAAVHASPPCQAHSALRSRWGDRGHMDLIAETRTLLDGLGLPYVIENVPGAPLRNPVTLCGSSFGLDVRRHRLFECHGFAVAPPSCDHGSQPFVWGVYGHTGASSDRGKATRAGRTNSIEDWRRAMGIDWMTVAEITQAIPPAYTRHIGGRLMRVIA